VEPGARASARNPGRGPGEALLDVGGGSEHQVALAEDEVEVRAEEVARIEAAGDGVRDSVLAHGPRARRETEGDLRLRLVQALLRDRVEVDLLREHVERVVDLD